MAVALGALLIIIATIIWSDRNPISSLQQTHALPSRLQIQRPGHIELVMHKQAENEWTLQEPCTLPVNAQRLTPLLNALRPSAHTYNASEVDLQAAGLTQPLSTVLLDDTQVLIGNTDLKGERRYIMRDSNVQFAPEWILSLIDGGISAFANLSMFAFDFQQVEATHTDGSAILLSNTDPLWWQELSAQQIVTWPIKDNGTSEVSLQLSFLSDSSNSSGISESEKQLATVHRYENFDAVTFEASDCAYILPSDTLPIVLPD